MAFREDHAPVAALVLSMGRGEGRRAPRPPAAASRSDQLDMGAMSRRRSQAPIAGYERGAEAFRKGDVGGVIGGQVVAKFPDARKKLLVGKLMQCEIDQVREDLAAALRAKGAKRPETSNDIGDLDIEQVRRMERLGRSPPVAFSPDQVGGRQRRSHRFPACEARPHLVEGRRLGHASHFSEKIVRQGHAGHGRARLERAMQQVGHVPNLNHRGHALDM